MEALHCKEYLQIVIIVSLIGSIQGQAAIVAGPEGGAIEAGRDVVLTCIPDSGPSSFYSWDDVSEGVSVRIFTNGWPTSDDAKYSNFASSPPGDTMTIITAAVDDEGLYQCMTEAANSPWYALTVEVGSTLTMTLSTTDPLIAGIEYTAVCDVIGSRPQLDITWTINDIPLGVTPVVTNPLNSNPDLSDTISEVTLTATPAMNGQDLKCTTSGHVVTSLNREETTQLNVQYAPTSETATIVVDLTKEGDTQLSVTCQVSAAVDGIDPANPVINNYIFYAGSEQIHSSTTDNSVLMDIPEYATDYRCTAGNDLGTIESETVNFDPGPNSTATPSTTDSENVTTSAAPSPAACVGNGTLLPRSYIITELGMAQFFRGWVDVLGQGAANDFCRFVHREGKPFMACLVAASVEDDILAYTSPSPEDEWFDPGYPNTWYMKDEDGDGRDDYCRCVGSVPDTVVKCVKAGPEGFLSNDYEFTPPGAPENCFYLTADPAFGFP